MTRTRKIIITICSLLAVTVLTALGSQFGGLRFVSPGANFRAGIASLCLPAVCVILLGFLPRSRARLWVFIGLVPFAVLYLFIGIVGAAFDPIFIRHSSFRLGYSDIVTYWSDAGAWDSGRVVVQQEIKLLPGLLWVRPLSQQDCLRDVSIKVINRHHIRCDYVADTTEGSLDPSSEAKRDKAWVF